MAKVSLLPARIMSGSLWSWKSGDVYGVWCIYSGQFEQILSQGGITQGKNKSLKVLLQDYQWFVLQSN